MSKSNATREKLLIQARRKTWANGYSNVSLREIAQSAGVDVALISRYFGGKLALFEATLDDAFDIPVFENATAMTDAIVSLFSSAPRDGHEPSVLQLMIMNARDPEVGDMVRQAQSANMQASLERSIGDKTQAALLMSVLLGFSIAEKSLRLDGLAHYQDPEYPKQIRHMLEAALSYKA